jgi:signal peptidase I
MRNGRLFINGTEVSRTDEGTYTETDDGPPKDFKLYLETLPNGVKHDILKISDNEPLDNTQEFLIPADCVFAMGDNRDNSLDSRVPSAVGFIPLENLVGRAEFLFFSIDARSPWWEVWQWPFEIRWRRLFTGIH